VTRIPEPPIPATGPQNVSLEEERREILASVMEALAGNAPDPDEMAACGYLLKHLLKAPAVSVRVSSLALYAVQQNRQCGRRFGVSAEA
jgi:hypothetical protein